MRNSRQDNITASNLVISGELFFDEAREGDEITDMLKKFWETDSIRIIYNYPPKGRCIEVDIYRDGKRRGIYPSLLTDPEGDSCFSIYQIRWIKKRFFNFFFWNFRETTRQFSLRSQNSEYPSIFRVIGANQNARKLLSTDLVNTNRKYRSDGSNAFQCQTKRRNFLWRSTLRSCLTGEERSLHQKLKAKPELLSEYNEIIKEQEQNGIVERAPVKNSESDLEAKRVHYSPHHAVVWKDRETTKVRVVYDVST